MNIKGKFFFVSFYLCSHLNCWWIQSLDIYWAVHSMPVSLKIEFLAKASNVWHIVRKIHMFSLSIFKAWKFRCPFSPYSVTISVSPRQGTYWETNVCAGRIILHLKFVIWSSSRFCNSQGGMKTLPNISHLQWSCLKSILLITRASQLATLSKIICRYRLTFWFGEIMDRANTIIVCIMFGAWIRKIQRTSLKRFGTIR